jgi:metal-dependent hydrolase (beta-lactamase superfamily II)
MGSESLNPWRLKRYLKAVVLLPFHKRKVLKAEEIWKQTRCKRIENWGDTKSLSILPLIDWHTSRGDLKTEMGVSYLIKTDHTSILFDVGYNKDATDPSPLEHNMKALGATMEDFEMIFISHCHFDHVGGHKNSRNKTISLGSRPSDFSTKKIFTPIPMTVPGAVCETTNEPRVLATGLATIGTIPRQLVTGWIEEQALAINVRKKGVVLIVGCGHQTLPKILKRTTQLFSEPIYGVLGGLHYPIPTGRVTWFGLNAQRLFSSGEGLFNPIQEQEVYRDIAILKTHKPGVVGLSGHDSSDAAIGWFKNHFGSAYRDIRVGEKIEIS